MQLSNWNPHIIDPGQLNRDPSVLDCFRSIGSFLAGDPSYGLTPYLSAREDLLKKFDTAVSLLTAIPGISAYFPDELPLAYKLVPTLNDMAVDDPSLPKFGGVPDLSGLLSQRALKSGKKLVEVVENFWPRCGVCHRSMRFIAQLDLGAPGTVLHALTAIPQQRYEQEITDLEDLRSGIGYGSLLSSSIINRWWYIFLCPEAGIGHHFNPNYAACLFADWRFRRSQNEQDPTELRNRPEIIEATTQFLEKSGEPTYHSIPWWHWRRRSKQSKSLADFEGPRFPPQSITSLNYAFDLDSPLSLDYDTDDAVDEVVGAHPEIFGERSTYTFFGSPHSQQDARRYFCPLPIEDSPVRMSPLLSFTDNDADMTYQLYADTLTFHHNIVYCRVDASCT